MARDRKEERRKYWEGVIAAQRASGLPVVRFCREQQLNEATFYWWRKKLSDRRSEAAPAPSQFIALPAVATVDKSAGYEVTLPKGIRVLVPPQFDASMLAKLIQTAILIEARDV